VKDRIGEVWQRLVLGHHEFHRLESAGERIEDKTEDLKRDGAKKRLISALAEYDRRMSSRTGYRSLNERKPHNRR